MAETNDNDSTGEYRLLCDEYEFVFALIKSPEMTEKVLREFLEGGATNPKFFTRPVRGPKDEPDGLFPGVDYKHERYRIWQLEGWSSGRWPSPFIPAFWRSDPERDIYSLIEHQHSSARWTGPVMYDLREISREDIALDWKLMGRPTGPANYRAVLISLHHAALLAMLRFLGLPPLATPAAPEPSTPPEMSVRKPPAPPPPESAPVDILTVSTAAEKLKSVPPNTVRHWVLSKMIASPGRIWESDFAETLMALCPIENTKKKTIQTCVGEFRKLFGTRPKK
jgi:hypothetical protein